MYILLPEPKHFSSEAAKKALHNSCESHFIKKIWKEIKAEAKQSLNKGKSIGEQVPTALLLLPQKREFGEAANPMGPNCPVVALEGSAHRARLPEPSSLQLCVLLLPAPMTNVVITLNVSFLQ